MQEEEKINEIQFWIQIKPPPPNDALRRSLDITEMWAGEASKEPFGSHKKWRGLYLKPLSFLALQQCYRFSNIKSSTVRTIRHVSQNHIDLFFPFRLPVASFNC